jgi:hypothetical protein
MIKREARGGARNLEEMNRSKTSARHTLDRLGGTEVSVPLMLYCYC